MIWSRKRWRAFRAPVPYARGIYVGQWYLIGMVELELRTSLRQLYPARLDPIKSEQWRGVLNIGFSVLKGKFTRDPFILDAHEEACEGPQKPTSSVGFCHVNESG